MSKSPCFTFTIVTHNPNQNFVFIKWFDDVDDAIAYAKGEIKDRSQYDVNFILIREGDARPSDPVIWDSRNVISLRNLAPVLDAAKPSDLRGSPAFKGSSTPSQILADLRGPNWDAVTTAIGAMAKNKASENNITLPVYEWVKPEPFKVNLRPDAMIADMDDHMSVHQYQLWFLIPQFNINVRHPVTSYGNAASIVHALDPNRVSGVRISRMCPEEGCEICIHKFY